MATTTAKAIRDRVLVLAEYIDPVSLTGTRLARYRNEGDGDFREWALANPTACLRRIQVRDAGFEDPAIISNNHIERHTLTLEILIAYPQDHRAGDLNALSRDDIIDEDWREIALNLGITGRGNFSVGGSYDCTPIGCTREMERDDGVDFLVITAAFEYERAVSQNGGLVAGLGLGLGG